MEYNQKQIVVKNKLVVMEAKMAEAKNEEIRLDKKVTMRSIAEFLELLVFH